MCAWSVSIAPQATLPSIAPTIPALRAVNLRPLHPSRILVKFEQEFEPLNIFEPKRRVPQLPQGSFEKWCSLKILGLPSGAKFGKSNIKNFEGHVFLGGKDRSWGQKIPSHADASCIIVFFGPATHPGSERCFGSQSQCQFQIMVTWFMWKITTFLTTSFYIHCLRLFMLRVSFCWVLLVGIYLLAHEELLKSFDNVGQANHC